MNLARLTASLLRDKIGTPVGNRTLCRTPVRCKEFINLSPLPKVKRVIKNWLTREDSNLRTVYTEYNRVTTCPLTTRVHANKMAPETGFEPVIFRVTTEPPYQSESSGIINGEVEGLFPRLP